MQSLTSEGYAVPQVLDVYKILGLKQQPKRQRVDVKASNMMILEEDNEDEQQASIVKLNLELEQLNIDKVTL